MLRQNLITELERLQEALAESSASADAIVEDLAEFAEEHELGPLAELSDYLLILVDMDDGESSAPLLSQIGSWLRALQNLFADAGANQRETLESLYQPMQSYLLENADLKLPAELVDALLTLAPEPQQCAETETTVAAEESDVESEVAEVTSPEATDSPSSSVQEQLQQLGQLVGNAEDLGAVLEDFAVLAEETENEALLELSDYLLILNDVAEHAPVREIGEWLNALSGLFTQSDKASQEHLRALYDELSTHLKDMADLEITPDLVSRLPFSVSEASAPSSGAVDNIEPDAVTDSPEAEALVDDTVVDGVPQSDAADSEQQPDEPLAAHHEPPETTVLATKAAPAVERSDAEISNNEETESELLDQVTDETPESVLEPPLETVSDALLKTTAEKDSRADSETEPQEAQPAVHAQASPIEIAPPEEAVSEDTVQADITTAEGVNQRLLDAFHSETVGQIKALVAQLEHEDSAPRMTREDLVRLPHSIRGAAAVLGLEPMAELAESLEAALDALPESGPSEHQQRILHLAAEQLSILLDAWENHRPYSVAPFNAALSQLHEAFDALAAESNEAEMLAQQATLETLLLEPKADLDPRLQHSFFLETPDQVMELSQQLQLTEDSEEKIDLEAAMRLAHTIKSSANLAGLDDLQNLAHLLEDLMEALGEHGGVARYHELLSETGDLFSLIGDGLESRMPSVEAPLQAIVARLQAAVVEVNGSAVGESSQDSETEAVEEDPFAVLTWDENAPAEQVDQFFEQAPAKIVRLGEMLTATKTYDKQSVTEVLKAAAQLSKEAGGIGLDTIADLLNGLVQLYGRFASFPPTTDEIPVVQQAADYLLVLGGVLLGEDEPKPGVSKLISTVKEVASRIRQEADGAPPKTTKTGAEEIIRLPLSTLNYLLSQVGELSSNNTLMRNSMEKVADLLLSLEQKGGYSRELLRDLTLIVETGNLGTQGAGRSDQLDPLEMDQYNALHSQTSAFAEALTDTLVLHKQAKIELDNAAGFVSIQERLGREISETVLAARMVSVDSLIPRMERTVREAARATGKRVRLVVKGEHLLLDTNVLNVIRDPLMHLLRNAVDHGIESAEVRRARGKSEEGAIFINFIHKGGRILIQVGDDGGGFSLDAIREAAQRHHLDAEQMDQQTLLQLLTSPGFSTRRKATKLSGRGVGLDVVRTAVEKIKGSLKLDMADNGGALFEMLVPITLVSVPALFVDVGGQIMALPSENVEQILYAEADQVKPLGNGWSYIHEGQPYVLRSLDNILGRGADRADVFAQGGVVLLMQVDNRSSAVYAKTVLERREVVVQPLSRWLGTVKGIIGGCILADGGVGPVLDLSALLTTGVQQHQPVFNTTAPAVAEQQLRQPNQVMIVDDSLSAREAAAIVLERAGYRVATAIDGFDAMKKIEQEMPALALVDMEMPNMNGIELTRHIKASTEWQDLPVVMLTSRSTPKHRQMAEVAGVDAYVTKPFDEADLLNTMQRLIQHRQTPAEEVYS
ncbi:response regulator [Thiolapillus sp.]